MNTQDEIAKSAFYDFGKGIGGLLDVEHPMGLFLFAAGKTWHRFYEDHRECRKDAGVFYAKGYRVGTVHLSPGRTKQDFLDNVDTFRSVTMMFQRRERGSL